jgi:hypothetical protein
MKSRLFSAAAVTFAVLLVVMPSVSASAQVAIWPGSVVAPFVHVQWNARQVHVCAPFVNIVVDLPRCCGRPSPCCETTGARGAYSQSDHWLYAHPTRQQLAKSAGKLYQSLDQFQTADSWRNYLAIAPGGVLSEQHPEHPSAEVANNEALVEVLRHFDTANREQQYQQITALPEFQQLHTLLANYLAAQLNAPINRTEPVSVELASSPWATVSQALQAGWAIDTARMAASGTAWQSVENTAGALDTAHRVLEELPSPARKGGI